MRVDAPEVLSRAPPAGLDLVGDEHNSVLVTDLLDRGEESVGRHREPTHPLDRLGDQTGNVTGGGGGDHLSQVIDIGLDIGSIVQVSERAAVAIAALDITDIHRREARSRPATVSGDTHRGERPAVVAVAHRQYLL